MADEKAKPATCSHGKCKEGPESTGRSLFTHSADPAQKPYCGKHYPEIAAAFAPKDDVQ